MKKTKKLSLEEIKDNFTAIEKDELISIKAGSGSSTGTDYYVITTVTLTDPTFDQLFAAAQSGDISDIAAGTYVNGSDSYTYTIDFYQATNTYPAPPKPHPTVQVTPKQLQTEFDPYDTSPNPTNASSFFSVVGELASKQKTGINENSYFRAYNLNNGVPTANISNEPSFADQQSFLQANFATEQAGVASTPGMFQTLVSHNYDMVTSLHITNNPNPIGDVVLVTGYNQTTGMYTYDDPNKGLYGQQASISQFNLADTVAVAVPPGGSQ